MSHEVFLSYAREDQTAVEKIYRQLQADAVTVWLDRSLRSGEFFPESINAALNATDAIVCVWSPASVRSDWVRAEALVGFQRKVLVPVRVGSCEIPVPFNGVHALDLSNWQGDGDFPEWRALLERLGQLLRRDALAAWAARTCPEEAVDLARIAQRYPADALAVTSRDIARERLGVDLNHVVIDDAMPTAEPPPPPGDKRQLRSIYEAKRRHIERMDEQGRARELEAIRHASGSAHSINNLASDLKKIFPTWSIEICFTSTGQESQYTQLVLLAATASDDALTAAHKSLTEEFRAKPGSRSFAEFMGDISERIGGLQVELSCGGFWVYVEWDDPIAACDLYEEHWTELSKFDPPSFDQFVEAQGGATDYYSGLSLLATWVRERFIEFCAVRGVDPSAQEREEQAKRLSARAGTSPAKTQKAGGVLNYFKEAALAFLLIVALVIAFGFVAQWVGLR